MTENLSKDFFLNTSEALVVLSIKNTMNIAAAAKSLGMPKTTLSSILAKLERKLGDSIFIRKQGSGAVTITDFGREALPKLEKFLWIGESFRPKEGIEGSRYNAGSLSIMSTQTILECFICPYLGSFLNENPEIKLCIRQKDEDYFYQPRPNEIFIGCWEDNTDNFLYIPFHRFAQKLWASRTYLQSNAPITCLEDLYHHRILIAQSIHEDQSMFANDFAVKRLGISSTSHDLLYVTGPRTLDALAEEGVGVISSSEETIRLGHLHLDPVLPQISGEEVPLFVKIDKKFIEYPLAQYTTDWIFSCRDRSLEKINMKPQTAYKPFLTH